MDLISKKTRNEFREALVGFVLREIEMFFEGADLSCNEDYNPPVTGARRTLVEQYYASIDFSAPNDIKRLLAAYGEIVLRLNRNGINDTTKDDLLRLMKRDGYDFDGECFVSLPSKQQPPIEAIRSLASSFERHCCWDTKEMVETICKIEEAIGFTKPDGRFFSCCSPFFLAITGLRRCCPGTYPYHPADLDPSTSSLTQGFLQRRHAWCPWCWRVLATRYRKPFAMGM